MTWGPSFTLSLIRQMVSLLTGADFVLILSLFPPLVKVFRDQRKPIAFRDQRKTYSISWSKKNLKHFVIKEKPSISWWKKNLAFRDQRKTYSILWTKNIPFACLRFNKVSWILDQYVCTIFSLIFRQIYRANSDWFQ